MEMALVFNSICGSVVCCDLRRLKLLLDIEESNGDLFPFAKWRGQAVLLDSVYSNFGINNPKYDAYFSGVSQLFVSTLKDSPTFKRISF